MKPYQAFTVKDFLPLVGLDTKIIITDTFEWETYHFENVGKLIASEQAEGLLSAWVFDVDIHHVNEVRLTINDAFEDEQGNAYFITVGADGQTYIEEGDSKA